MIHIDRGGDRHGTKAFFDKLASYRVEYDVIGQSYYPWWHGSLHDLRENLDFMANEYDKDIILVEVAYNWRPAEYRKQARPVPRDARGPEGVPGRGEPDRPGHARRRGIGIFWWEPAVAGPLRNRGFFDDDGNALPVIAVFDPSRLPAQDKPPSIGIFEGHGDVGTVLHPGSVAFDAAAADATPSPAAARTCGSTRDAFHFVWKKASGDLALAADVAFLGAGRSRIARPA